LPAKLMTLEIDLPGGECITVQGQPLYLRPGVGFAMKFVNVPRETDKTLQRVLAKLAASGHRQS
jgi:hypothetical protein